MTLSIVTFSIKINETQHSAYLQTVVVPSVIMLNVANNPFVLSVIMLSVVMLNVHRGAILTCQSVNASY